MLIATHTKILRKVVLIGLIGFLLVAVFSCGVFQTPGHHGGSDIVECDTVASVIGGVSIRDFALYAALFAIVASLLSILSRHTYYKALATISPVTRVSQLRDRPQLFLDSIREAFRRGLIHSQIYNDAFS